ncbi:TonB-dependent receptor [Sphingomonas sp. TX0543]|uniref:TonB-dependent receptor n=1 Tax=Sphingomonas sp. TX0543 TaxID=3399682 RepID=UPI003AFB7812
MKNLLMLCSACVPLGFSSVAFAQSAPPPQAANSGEAQADDIVVTAQKRSERLIEVPLSISVVQSATIASQNLVKLEDIVARVPGLATNTAEFGQVQIAVRGVTTGGLNNSTVGVTVDDVPVGGTTIASYGNLFVPELDPGVLQQIEVLRGPQGTLYGASSLGGLLRYVTADPRFGVTSGSVAVSSTSVDHGDVGFGTRAVLNLPVASNAALLVNGFFRRDPGYVDDAALGLKNVNRADNYGGRAALRLGVTDTLSVKLAALVQKTTGDGSAQIDADRDLNILRPYNQTRLIGTGAYSNKIELFTGVINLDMGFATATSVTGYSVSHNVYSQDGTDYLSYPPPIAIGRSDVGVNVIFNGLLKKFSQEFHIASRTNQPLEWLVGAFYTYEKSSISSSFLAVERTTGKTIEDMYPGVGPGSYREYAAFASLTYHFTDRFDLQAGGRYGHNNQSQVNIVTSGPFAGETSGRSSENVFTYSVTPRFRISPTQTLYARLAAGYRPGGPNQGIIGLPPTYHSDSTLNYEIGYKANLFDHKLSIDAAVYRIDWKDIALQVLDLNTNFPYFTNGGRARSQGVELSGTLRPVRPLTLGLTVGYTDAKLRDDIPGVPGSPMKGDRLPFSAPWSASFSADYDFTIGAQTKASLGFGVNYLDKRRGGFMDYGQVTYPSYTTADVRASLQRAGWKLSTFVSNIFDKRIPVGGDQISPGNPRFGLIINRPRTIGVDLSRAF